MFSVDTYSLRTCVVFPRHGTHGTHDHHQENVLEIKAVSISIPKQRLQKSPAITPTKWHSVLTFLTCLKPKGSKVYESFEMTPELRSNKS
jgi:hypothetical protein